MQLAVTLMSIASNVSTSAECFVFDCGISPQSRERILAPLAGKSLKVHFVPVDLSPFANVDGHGGYQTSATFARMLLGSLLPSRVERVLFLDSDLAVDDDLMPLWRSSTNGQIAAAVVDVFFPRSGLADIGMFSALGIPADTLYFNCGVMLIDVRLWREAKIEQQLLGLVRRFPTQSKFYDQCYLNAALAGRVVEIMPRWNATPTMGVYPDGRSSPYPPAAFDEAMRRPAIQHFMSGRKPWQENVRVAHGDIFFKYLDLTHWRGWRPSGWGSLRSLLLRHPNMDPYRAFVIRKRLQGVVPGIDTSLSHYLMAFARNVCRSPGILFLPFRYLFLRAIGRSARRRK